MALTPLRPSVVAPWPAGSSPDPISMLTTPAKRVSGSSNLVPEREAKRRKLSPESDASTRTTPSMIVPDSQAGVDARSELSDTPMTPTPMTERPATFFVSEPGLKPQEKMMPKLPDALLLLMIPQLVLEPPSSPKHISSLYVSWLALRRCLRLTLGAEVEIRALTGLVEVGLMVLDAEVEEPWVKGVAGEAEKAVLKGLGIAKAHPTLSHYLTPLQYLHVRLATLHGPVKRALTLSKQMLKEASSASTAASWLHYLHHSHVLSDLTPSQVPAQLSHLSNPPSVDRLYTRIHSLLRLAHLLTEQPEGYQDDCRSLLASFGKAPGLQGPEAFLLLITQILSLLHYASAPIPTEISEDTSMDTSKDTSKGSSNDDPKNTSPVTLLDTLPELLDNILSVSVAAPPSTTRNIPIMTPSPPKKLVLALACLVAASASRDASGRQSKRGIWATEGLKLFDEDMDELPRWYTLKQKKALEKQLAEVKALLLCELVSVSIVRSEFEDAKKNLDQLVELACSANLFMEYSPVISLLHGRLAHSVFSVARAHECYSTAAYLATQQEKPEIRFAAILDLLGLRLGLGEDVGVESEELLLEIEDWKDENLREPAVVFRALTAREIHKSKQHLKKALDNATLRSDNYLRLLILCITAYHYQLTKPSRSLSALQMCRHVCLSLGAPPEGDKPQPHAFGNASLGLWVGEKYAELLQRQGNEKHSKKQENINKNLRERWTAIQEKMGLVLEGGH